jgi:hypothetical protein
MPWLRDLASTWGICRPRAHVQPLGFKRLHHNVSFLPQEMHTIEQARRVLDVAFTATITRFTGGAGLDYIDVTEFETWRSAFGDERSSVVTWRESTPLD